MRITRLTIASAALTVWQSATLPILCLAVLTSVSVARAQGSAIPAGKLPSLLAPKMAQPPTVDGILDAREWQSAAAISGVSQQNPGGNLLVMRPTTYFLAWDEGNLYLAARTWVMPGYKPRVGGRAPGTVTAFDDGLEFNFKPMGRNVSAGRADSSYKFFISAIGSTGDLARQSVGQLFRNWQPQFRIATRMTPVGSAPLGGRWLEIETAMSVKDFELTGPNRAGDKWKMLLAYNHMPGWMQAAIPINTPYFDPSGFPEITLAADAPAAQVTMDDLPGPLDGVANAQFQIHNSTGVPVTAKIEAIYALQKGGELLRKTQTLTIAPGQSEKWAFNEKLPDMGADIGSMEWQVTQGGGRQLLRYFTWFKRGYEPKWVQADPPPVGFPISGTFNPARHNFSFSADTYGFDRPQDARSVSYAITREGETKPLAQGTLSEIKYFYFGELIKLPRLSQGKYNVSATITMKDGKTVGPVTTQFSMLDEAKAFPAWWNTKLGDTERVLKPFSPIRRNGQALSLWGRAYRLNALGLPQQISSQGQTMMTAPARIVVTRGGRETVVPLDGKLSFSQEKAWRVGFSGTAQGAGLKFKAQGTIEQDGLAKISLTYAPVGTPLKVDGLRLEFPLRADVAQNLACMGPGGNFASISHPSLKSRTGQGRIWSTLEVGKGGSGMTEGNFYPDVWLGSEKRGLLWWADSDEGWVPNDAVAAHEVVRQGQSVVLRNNIIGAPFQLAAPRTFTFSYNASPFKPLVKGWRWAIHSEDGTFDGPHKKRKDPRTGQEVDGWNWISPPSRDPAQWSALWAQAKVAADAGVRAWQPTDPSRSRNYLGARETHTSLPLHGYGALSPQTDVFSYFAAEWGEGNFTRTQQDYYLYLIDRAMREGGIRTFYWDIFYILPIKQMQAGFGYALPDGRIQTAFNGFELRRFMMRLMALQQDRGLYPGGNVTHGTNDYPLVAFPWVDAILDGEWAEVRDGSPLDWVDQYSPQRMQALSVSGNWGTQISWMHLIKTTDPILRARIERGYVDWQRMHDSWTGPNGLYPPNALLEFGLNDQKAHFVPYWRAGGIRSGDKDIFVSQWRLADRVVLAAFNHSDKATAPKNVTLKLDWKALGFKPGASGTFTAREMGEVGDPGVSLNGDTLSIPALAPHTARYIGLRRDGQERSAPSLHLVPEGLRSHRVLQSLLDWGFTPQAISGTKADNVTAKASGAQVALSRLPGRVLFAVTGVGAAAQDVRVVLDLKALGLQKQLPWQEFVRARDFGAAGGNTATQFDYYTGVLNLPQLKPGETRYIGVRKY